MGLGRFGLVFLLLFGLELEDSRISTLWLLLYCSGIRYLCTCDICHCLGRSATNANTALESKTASGRCATNGYSHISVIQGA